MVKNRLQCGRPGFNTWVGKISWRRKWQPSPVFLPGKSHEQRSLEDYSPWGHKELDTTVELTHFPILTKDWKWPFKFFNNFQLYSKEKMTWYNIQIQGISEAVKTYFSKSQGLIFNLFKILFYLIHISQRKNNI